MAALVLSLFSLMLAPETSVKSLWIPMNLDTELTRTWITCIKGLIVASNSLILPSPQ